MLVESGVNLCAPLTVTAAPVDHRFCLSTGRFVGAVVARDSHSARRQSPPPRRIAAATAAGIRSDDEDDVDGRTDERWRRNGAGVRAAVGSREAGDARRRRWETAAGISIEAAAPWAATVTRRATRPREGRRRVRAAPAAVTAAAAAAVPAAAGITAPARAGRRLRSSVTAAPFSSWCSARRRPPPASSWQLPATSSTRSRC